VVIALDREPAMLVGCRGPEAAAEGADDLQAPRGDEEVPESAVTVDRPERQARARGPIAALEQALEDET